MNQRKIFVVFGDSDVIVLSFWPYLVMPELKRLDHFVPNFQKGWKQWEDDRRLEEDSHGSRTNVFTRFFFWSIFRKKNGCGDAFFQAHMRTMRPKHPTAAAAAIAVVVQLFSADDG